MSICCASSRGRLYLAALAAIGMTFGLPAAAQSAEEEADEGDSLVEEIVVTATYRDTQLMDTPLTISALTDVDIEQRGVEDIKNLFLAIPGLNYGNATQTWHRITARGVAQFRSPTGPIAMYVDNIPVQGTGSRQPLLPNFDLERIEVLKGPQGSLYGEGSMAGAVRYITRKPNPEGFDWAIKVRFEDQTQSSDLGHRIDAMVNIPLGEKLAARITPYSRNKPGLLDKYGPEIIEDVDYVDEQGYRAQLAFYPTDALTIVGTAYHVYSDIGGPGIAHHCYVDRRPAGNIPDNDREPEVPPYPVVGGCESGPNGTLDGETGRFKDGPDAVYVTHMASNQFNDGGESSSTIFNLTAEWSLGWADLIVSTGNYQHDITYGEETRSGFVRPGSAWPVAVDAACEIAGCPPGSFWARSSVRAHSDVNERQAHEVRLVSTTGNRLQWSVGAFSQDIENGDDPKSWMHCGALGPKHGVIYGGPEYPDITCQRNGLSFNPAVSLEQMRAVHRLLQEGFMRTGGAGYTVRDEQALFGEVSYALSDQWEILGGVRYAESEFTALGGPSGRWVPLSEATPRAETQTQEKAAPKVTLTWRPNDNVMIYGTWATAFRAGGVNTGLTSRVTEYQELAARGVPQAAELAERASELLTFGGDDIESLELGVKATVLDGRLDLTLNAYDMKMNNAVVSTSGEFPALVDPTTAVPIADAYTRPVTDNVGQASSRGVEFEVRGQLTDALSLHAGGAWVPDAETQTQEAGRFVGGVQLISIEPGNRIRFTPILSYFASLMYDFELMGHDATVRGDVYHRGKEIYRTENNLRPTPTYTFLNLKLMLRRDNYEYGVYIKNVNDAIAPYAIGDSGYHGFNPPRSFGLELSYTP